MIDWPHTAIVFPGQASQQVGMGADLAAQFPEAAITFAQADLHFGYPFSSLLFNGPADQLDLTANTQPALYLCGVATWSALRSLYDEAAQPVAFAGHSLGEFTALTAAGALSFTDGLRLVRERGRLMALAGEQRPGAMAALLGATVEEARALCADASGAAGGVVVVANDNCPGQVVISGEAAAVEEAIRLAKERGIKRALRLAVSVAAHSPLMAEAAAQFAALLEATPFETPRAPIIGNTTAAPLTTREEILAELRAQLTESVRWTESVQALRGLGAAHFLELGPKDVLSGLIRRIDKEAVTTPVNSAAALTTLAPSGG
jgi:[acyl-carrier-protein] S-malonyltransferase